MTIRIVSDYQKILEILVNVLEIMRNIFKIIRITINYLKNYFPYVPINRLPPLFPAASRYQYSQNNQLPVHSKCKILFLQTKVDGPLWIYSIFVEVGMCRITV